MASHSQISKKVRIRQGKLEGSSVNSCFIEGYIYSLNGLNVYIKFNIINLRKYKKFYQKNKKK